MDDKIHRLWDAIKQHTHDIQTKKIQQPLSPTPNPDNGVRQTTIQQLPSPTPHPDNGVRQTTIQLPLLPTPMQAPQASAITPRNLQHSASFYVSGAPTSPQAVIAQTPVYGTNSPTIHVGGSMSVQTGTAQVPMSAVSSPAWTARAPTSHQGSAQILPTPMQAPQASATTPRNLQHSASVYVSGAPTSPQAVIAQAPVYGTNGATIHVSSSMSVQAGTAQVPMTAWTAQAPTSHQGSAHIPAFTPSSASHQASTGVVFVLA